jgi:kynurenine formamidase
LETSASSIADWAEHGLVTRGVFLDVAAARGAPWIAPGEPVTNDDLLRAQDRAGVGLEPGDAVLLCMGRDQYEADERPYEALIGGSAPVPGIGEEGIRWLAEHRPGILLWDFLEASESPLVAHMLIWAVGLPLVDNCDFRACRDAMKHRRIQTGLVSVAPLRIQLATGCPVNPLLLL